MGVSADDAPFEAEGGEALMLSEAGTLVRAIYGIELTVFRN